MIWFNKDGSITQEHHANSSSDLGHWDSPYFRAWSGVHEKYDYSLEEYGHRYSQLNMALARTAIWMESNPKCQVHDPVLKAALNEMEEDVKTSIDNISEALGSGALEYPEGFMDRKSAAYLRDCFPRLKARYPDFTA